MEYTKTLILAILGLFLVFIVVIITTTVLADSLYEQTNSTTISANAGEFVQYLSTADPADFQATFNTIKVKLEIVSSTYPLTLQVAPLVSCSASAGLDTATQNIVMTTIDDLVEQPKIYTFTTATTSTISGKCYAFKIQQQTIPPFIFGAPSSTDNYVNGILKDSGGSPDSEVSDAFFQICSSSSCDQLNDIVIEDPANDETLSDFSNFEGYFTTAASTQGKEITIDVRLASTSELLDDDSQNFLYRRIFDGFDDTQTSPTGWTMIKNNALLWGNSFYTRANLFINDVGVATSSINYFTIGNPDSYVGGIECGSFSSSTSIGNFFGDAACRFFFTLFVPKQSAFDDFINLKDDLVNKPPFGYLKSITDAFSFDTEATSSVELAPLEGFEPIFEPIRTGLSWLVWVMFGFWVFHRFRYFNF